MTRIALVFPGQGSQKVGMGQGWAERSAAARRTFEEADEAVGFGLSRLVREGPEEELVLTANTQPAILATSVAILRGLEEEEGVEVRPAAVAGHSLGEYTALVAAGALELGDALRLVRRRGELMQEAVPAGEGAMAAVLGLDAAAVEGIVADAQGEDGVLAVANYNAPEQTVIAGHVAPVERAVGLAKERGAKRAMMLPVSAPFHSPLMGPARRGMTPLLDAADFRDPSMPVVVNVDARPVRQGPELRDALVRQIDGAVRWVESVERMAGEMGIDLFVEVGPGAVLTGLVRRIAPGAGALSLADPSGLGKLAEALGTEGGGAG